MNLAALCKKPTTLSKKGFRMRSLLKTGGHTLFVTFVACWIVLPRAAEAALVQFDFTSTVQVGHDQLPGYSVEDSPILRGRVIFDTGKFEPAQFGFQPVTWENGGELVLSSLSASGDAAVTQADFWLDDQLMWSGSNAPSLLGFQRQGRVGGFDGGWNVHFDGFWFASIEGVPVLDRKSVV